MEIALTVLGLLVLVAWGVLWTVMSAALVVFEPRSKAPPRLAGFRKWPVDVEANAQGTRQARQH